MSNPHSFDKHHLLQVLDPVASQVSANSAWIEPFADGGGADRATFFIFYGAVGTSIDAKVTQATSAAGAGAKDITGAALVQITAADAIASIEIGPGAMDDKNGFKFVRFEVTVAGTVVWGTFVAKHRLRHPGQLSQHATYVQFVRVYN